MSVLYNEHDVPQHIDSIIKLTTSEQTSLDNYFMSFEKFSKRIKS